MLSLFIIIVICFGGAAIGSLATNSSLKTWYPTIKKPTWNPPNAIFGPVWSALYLMMAIACWLVWTRTPPVNLGLPIFCFGVQLFLNIIWSLIFFGLRKPGWAFIELVLLWLSIILTTVSFWQAFWIAGLLFLPYLLWVSFAGFLNYTIWQMNK